MSTDVNREQGGVKAGAQPQHLVVAADDLYRHVENDDVELAELNALGDRHARDGDREEAVRCFEHAARAYRAVSSPGKALAVYKKIARLDEEHLEARLALAELSVALNRRHDARAYYNDALRLDRVGVVTPRTVRLLKGICDLDPADTDLRLELARRCVSGGYPFEANEAFVAAAREHFGRGETVEAEAAYRAALANNPVSAAALGGLADLLIAGGLVDEAVDLVAAAAEQRPLDTLLLTLLGKTCRKVNRLDDAERVFTRLLEIDPLLSRHLLEVGSRLASAGELDRALEIVDRVLALGARPCKRVVGLLKQIAAADWARDEALERLAEVYGRTGDVAGERAALARLADLAARRGAADREAGLLRRLAGLEPEGAEQDSRHAAPAPAPSVAPCDAAAVEDGFLAEIEVDDAREGGGAAGRSAGLLELARRHHRRGDAAAAKAALYEAFCLEAAAEASGSTSVSRAMVVRPFGRHLDAEWRRAARASTAVSVLRVLVDVGEGPEEAVIDALEGALDRPGDLLVRCGRGDYVAVLPGTYRNGATLVAEKLCAHALARVGCAASGVRVGIASAVPSHAGDPEELVREAERARSSTTEAEPIVAVQL